LNCPYTARKKREAEEETAKLRKKRQEDDDVAALNKRGEFLLQRVDVQYLSSMLICSQRMPL